jgi:chorismate lyase/3-hydroxybenzoate synthase
LHSSISAQLVMDLTLPPACAGPADAARVAALPPLRVEYSTLTAPALLAQADTLAVIGFDRDGPSDARYTRVALQPAFETAALEVWREDGPIETGSDGALRFSRGSHYAFVVVEMQEAQFANDIRVATQAAYTLLAQWCARSAMPLLRIWNYIDAINRGAGDEERYRQFCAGRAAGMDAMLTRGYPAASAIGVRDGRRVLQVCALAARATGEPVENPRQVSAWHYPRQYGPVAPGFARAIRAPSTSPQLYISGTAAVVGHASHHAGDVSAQVEETLNNLDSLCSAAGNAAPLGGARDVLRAYVRHASDAALVRERLHARLGAQTPLLVLLGDICRSELLVEIDGLHQG